MCPNQQVPADLIAYTGEILNEKLNFLCSEKFWCNSDMMQEISLETNEI